MNFNKRQDASCAFFFGFLRDCLSTCADFRFRIGRWIVHPSFFPGFCFSSTLIRTLKYSIILSDFKDIWNLWRFLSILCFMVVGGSPKKSISPQYIHMVRQNSPPYLRVHQVTSTMGIEGNFLYWNIKLMIECIDGRHYSASEFYVFQPSDIFSKLQNEIEPFFNNFLN